MLQRLNILGALITVIILVLCCSIFIVRMGNQESTEYWLGIILLMLIFPLFYLLVSAKKYKRPAIYSLQIVLMLTFLLVEFVFDYLLIFPFREIKWMTICYVTLFFTSTGGMIGVASYAGKTWTVIGVVLFFNMFALAFYQRAITGM